MADLKISQLTAITTLTPATDVLPVVDVTGTTKKITTNQLLGSGGTATLASATITGDLTVRTNGLIVNTTGVGIGISPTRNLSLFSSASPVLQLCDSTSGTTLNDGLLITQAGVNTFIENAEIGAMNFRTSSVTRYQIDSTGISTWSVGGSTAMTLNATGLGIGVTPSAWGSGFRYVQAGPGCAYGTNGSVDRTDLAANWYYNGGDKYINATGKASIFQQSGGAFLWLSTNTASGGAGSAMTLNTNMTLDASGNLLVGTTVSPSGTKIGSIAKLGKVNVEGTNTVSVSTSVVPLARAFDSGGLFFISGYNTTGGSQGWWLVAARGSAVTTIASDNGTGLTVAFTVVSGAILSMNTTSGTLNVSCISMTNQSV